MLCGNAQDCGGYCHELCPATDETTAVDGTPCFNSWHPRDVHVYLQRETRARSTGAWRNNPCACVHVNVHVHIRYIHQTHAPVSLPVLPVPVSLPVLPRMCAWRCYPLPSPLPDHSTLACPRRTDNEFLMDGQAGWLNLMPQVIEAFLAATDGSVPAVRDAFVNQCAPAG